MAGGTQTKEELIKSLESRVRLHAAPKWQKLLRIPGRMIASELVRRSKQNRVERRRVRTFWGGTMTMILPEPVSLGIYRYGMHEGDVSRVLIELLKPGMTFYDVGAHFGYFSSLASHLVGLSGRVHSFEPTKSTFDVLRENVGGSGNVVINNVAAFRESGSLEFRDYGVARSAWNSFTSARLDGSEAKELKAQTYQVETVALDDYVARSGSRPDVVKIDAESAEMEILRGFERTLRESKPTVLMEVGDFDVSGASDSASLVGHLAGLGYVAHEWVGDRLTPHERRERYDYGNLVFVPREKA